MRNESESTSTQPKSDEAGLNEARLNEGMVAAWSSSNHDAEMEALNIKGVLDSNGIPAMIVGPHMLPNLEFQVQVPEHLLGNATILLRDARRAGPAAAAEAERLTE